MKHEELFLKCQKGDSVSPPWRPVFHAVVKHSRTSEATAWALRGSAISCQPALPDQRERAISQGLGFQSLLVRVTFHSLLLGWAQSLPMNHPPWNAPTNLMIRGEAQQRAISSADCKERFSLALSTEHETSL